MEVGGGSLHGLVSRSKCKEVALRESAGAIFEAILVPRGENRSGVSFR